MSTVPYRTEQEIPVLADVDVVVIGGGPGGIGASVMAARAGARTMLVERFGFPGGMASVGEVHPFMSNHADGKCLDRPVYVEWIQRMRAYQPGEGELHEELTDRRDRMISKDLAMLAAEDLLREAGVELLYHHHLADVRTTADEAGTRITEAVLFSKSGFSAVRAGVFVDCTGDGDLAVKAGCGFEKGGPSGHGQPMTLCFKLSNIDQSAVPPREEINARYDRAKADGRVSCPRENVLIFDWLDDDVLHFNTTRVIHHDATDGASLSDAEIIARDQLRELLTFLRDDIPGFANARVHSIAHHIGVRESRRILGRAYLTREDFQAARKFPDAIARCRYPIDIHNPDGSGTEITRLPEGQWYEIPYGCVVARDVANLLVGGRPISVDHAVHSSMRVMPPACTVGQAAGLAAAWSAKRGCSPAEIDGVELRNELIHQGAFLKPMEVPAE